MGVRKSDNTDSKFTYFNGQVVDNIYTNWRANEPSGDGLCIQKHWWFDGGWNDIPCEGKYLYFCYSKPKMEISKQPLSYDEAKKICKLFTPKSWYDLDVANKIASGKSFWTGTQKLNSQGSHITPEGFTNCFTEAVNKDIGCSYSNNPNSLQVTNDCNNEKKYFFCRGTFTPTNSPTKKPTNKPTKNPTFDPYRYQTPVILPIGLQTVSVGSFITIPILTKELEDPSTYGNIIWTMINSQNKPIQEEWISLQGLTGSRAILIVAPTEQFIGYYNFLVKATNPHGAVGNVLVSIKINPKPTNNPTNKPTNNPTIKRTYENYDQYINRIQIQNAATWDDANNQCIKMGSRLVNPFCEP